MKLEPLTRSLASSLFPTQSQSERFPRQKHAFTKSPKKADSKIVRRRCNGSYDKITNDSGRKEALAKAKQVDTKCVLCKKTFCLACFNPNYTE